MLAADSNKCKQKKGGFRCIRDSQYTQIFDKYDRK